MSADFNKYNIGLKVYAAYMGRRNGELNEF